MSNERDYKNRSDEELVILAKNRDQFVFRILVKRYINKIYRFARSYNISSDDAEDIAQETFIKSWKKLQTFDPTFKFQTWLFTIARNTILDKLRKNKLLPFSFFENTDGEFYSSNPIDDVADSEVLADEIFDKTKDINKLQQSLAQLGSDERTIIVLHYEEELTFEEIGKILDKPMNTVKSLHRRSLIKLKEKLDKTSQNDISKNS
jgi:RNA polymerase sigma-70 factor (ECF subfamily)